ncbi:MAG: discoidin domain-containing protein [Geminicoccaceae bacterium]
MRAAGKTMRMWNDGIKAGDGTISPAPDIIVEYWTNSGLTPQQLVDTGHTVSNQSWDPTYYVLGGAKPSVTWGYETWTPDLFQGGATIGATSRNRGSNLHVWCDNPNAETEDQIAAGIAYPLRVIAQQTWGSPKPVASYPAFQSIADAVGRSPGWPTQTPPDDLAAGKPVTVSSTETPSFPGFAATDGSYATRWSSAYADPSWIQVDLGAASVVNRVVLRWETAYGRGYAIQVSDDAATWTTIYSTNIGDGNVDDLTGLTGSGRYVRMYGTARGTQFGYSLWEFEVYTNRARNRPTTASSTETPGFPGFAATDGSSATRWSSAYADPSWIQVDLGATLAITHVVLRWETAYAHAYAIQVSDDAATWTTIYSTSTGDGGIDDLTGLTGSGRYVRMYGTVRATQFGYSLWEFEVYVV